MNIVHIVTLDELQRQLEAFARSRSLSHGLVLRAKIILSAADGEQSGKIVQQLNVSRHSVALWRRRFAQRGIEGLYDEY